MKRFSLVALLLSYLLIFSFLAYYPKFEKPGSEATISYDVAGYYFYLPAIFIYKDVHHLQFQEEMNAKYKYSPGAYQGVQLPDGNYTMKYPMGAAIMYAPYFFMAHGYASLAGLQADGFSAPYQRFLSLGCVIYALLGLWVLRKILLRYFSEVATGITLLILVAATNYLNYSAIDHAMTHNLLFTVFTLVIWFTIRLYETNKIRYAIILGLLCGLATITRPTDIIICIIPALWGVSNFSDLRGRFQFFIKQYRLLLVFVFFAAVVGSLQLIFWKITTGNWLFYSYEDQGFDWRKPHLIEGLFSYKKGWLLYTPVMALILPGFIYLYRKNKATFYSVLLFTVINIYIVFSWSVWWYGGSLGQRSMVESYAILALPIAALITAVINSKKWIQIPFFGFILFCSYYNIVLTIQAHHKQSILDAENTNRTYFWLTFCKLHIDNDIKKYLDTNEIYHGSTNNLKPLYFNDIESDTLHIDTTSKIGGKKCLYITTNEQFTVAYAVPLPPEGTKWLRVSADFITDDITWDVWKMPQFIIQFKQDNAIVKTEFIRIHRLMSPDQMYHLYFDTKTPKKTYNHIDVFLWNADGKSTTFMDNIKVEILE